VRSTRVQRSLTRAARSGGSTSLSAPSDERFARRAEQRQCAGIRFVIDPVHDLVISVSFRTQDDDDRRRVLEDGTQLRLFGRQAFACSASRCARASASA
jgi:hypothetical protein